MPQLFSKIDEHTKLIFICSPNNPTGNNFREVDILSILSVFNGIVVVDEAYIDFSNQPSLLKKLDDFPNLIVIQTLSKAWGLAGLRLGIAFAAPEIILLFNKIKPPYNINQATQTLVLEALKEEHKIKEWIKEIRSERERISLILKEIDGILHVYHSDANFILIKLIDSLSLYQYLAEREIIVRKRSMVDLCENCLRISIGTPEQNNLLVASIIAYFTC